MADELEARDIAFYPAYVSRAHERTQVLRQLLSEKVCGERVTSIKYTQRGSSLARGLDVDAIIPWRLNANHSGGGLIMDMGCHILDRIDYIFGPIVNVTSTVLRKGAIGEHHEGGDLASSSNPLVEDYVAMSATIGECNWSPISSAGATVECVWDYSPKERSNDGNAKQEDDIDELIISGPGGSLRMAGMGAGLPIELHDANGRLVKTLTFEAPKHAAQPLIQSVVDELLGLRGARCPSRAENAIRTSEVLDSILGSYYGGRHDEYWRRPETWPGYLAS